MWPVMPCLSRSAFQADAIFVSGPQRGDEPSAGQVRQTVAAAIRTFGYSGRAGRVAQEFGDHPETAVVRMRWARVMAREAFTDSVSEPGPQTGLYALLIVHPWPPAGQASGSREAMA